MSARTMHRLLSLPNAVLDGLRTRIAENDIPEALRVLFQCTCRGMIAAHFTQREGWPMIVAPSSEHFHIESAVLCGLDLKDRETTLVYVRARIEEESTPTEWIYRS
jgi:hypothetical protein